MKDELLSGLKKYCKDCEEQLRVIAWQAFSDVFYLKNFQVFHVYPFPPPSVEIYHEILKTVLDSPDEDDCANVKDEMDDDEYKEFLFKQLLVHHGKRTILELDIHDPLNFANIWTLSFGLREVYLKFEHVDKIRKVDLDVFLDSEHLRRDIQSKYFELLGYWTAKIEERRKNMNGGGATRKAHKIKNIEITKKGLEKLKEGNKKDLKDFRIKLQQQLGVTDRTILRYLQTTNTMIGQNTDLT